MIFWDESSIDDYITRAGGRGVDGDSLKRSKKHQNNIENY
jgi:hypothetical protein